MLQLVARATKRMKLPSTPPAEKVFFKPARLWDWKQALAPPGKSPPAPRAYGNAVRRRVDHTISQADGSATAPEGEKGCSVADSSSGNLFTFTDSHRIFALNTKHPASGPTVLGAYVNTIMRQIQQVVNCNIWTQRYLVKHTKCI